MAREPTDLVLELLREIRAKLAEHGERLDAHEKRFDALDQRLDVLGQKIADWRETIATLNHADLRESRIEARLADLARRVEKLEEARRMRTAAAGSRAGSVPASDSPSTMTEPAASDAVPGFGVAGEEAAAAPDEAARRAPQRA